MQPSFEVNEGQTDSQALFLTRTPNYTAFITQQGFMTSGPVGNAAQPNAAPTEMAQDIQFLNTNPTATPIAQQLLPGVSNYFIGNDPTQWLTRVPNYGQVVVPNLYKNINVVYSTADQQLEFALVVNPGGNLNSVSLLSNYGGLGIGNGGQLLLAGVNGGTTEVSAPMAYQVVNGLQVAINCQYVLLGANTIGFQAIGYDPTKQLVIDPMVSYATYLGGSMTDIASAIGVDAAGDAYVTGTTNSINFPVNGPFQTANAGMTDAFVTAVNPTGTALLYSTYLGGTGNDQGLGIAVNAAGNAYVTGTTGSMNFPVTAGALQSMNAGTNNAFVAELNVGGASLAYATYLGGMTSDQGNAIAIDAAGDAFVTGETNSMNFPTTAGAFQTTLPGVQAAFVAEVNTTGSALTYATYLGGAPAPTPATASPWTPPGRPTWRVRPPQTTSQRRAESSREALAVVREMPSWPRSISAARPCSGPPTWAAPARTRPTASRWTKTPTCSSWVRPAPTTSRRRGACTRIRPRAAPTCSSPS